METAPMTEPARPRPRGPEHAAAIRAGLRKAREARTAAGRPSSHTTARRRLLATERALRAKMPPGDLDQPTRALLRSAASLVLLAGQLGELAVADPQHGRAASAAITSARAAGQMLTRLGIWKATAEPEPVESHADRVKRWSQLAAEAEDDEEDAK